MGRPITPAVKYSPDDPAFRIANSVLTEILGREPMIGYVGGGVPVLSYMRLLAGRDLITFGFQREAENFHAPNEFLRLSSFKMAQGAYVKLLQAHVDKPARPAEPVLELSETGEFIKAHPEARGGHEGYREVLSVAQMTPEHIRNQKLLEFADETFDLGGRVAPGIGATGIHGFAQLNEQRFAAGASSDHPGGGGSLAFWAVAVTQDVASLATAVAFSASSLRC